MEQGLREAVQSLALEVFQTRLDAAQSRFIWPWSWLCFGQGLDPASRSLPPWTPRIVVFPLSLCLKEAFVHIWRPLTVSWQYCCNELWYKRWWFLLEKESLNWKNAPLKTSRETWLGEFRSFTTAHLFYGKCNTCLGKVRALHPVKSEISRRAEYIQELCPIHVVTHPDVGIWFKK